MLAVVIIARVVFDEFWSARLCFLGFGISPPNPCGLKNVHGNPIDNCRKGTVVDDRYPIGYWVVSSGHMKLVVFAKLLDVAIPKTTGHYINHSNRQHEDGQ